MQAIKCQGLGKLLVLGLLSCLSVVAYGQAKPGMRDGVAVPVSYTAPSSFKIQ
jgi:hypothetical protein